ncbi:nyd-sp28 protein [Holotrichia oblita]|uniref:Nyd-sp28 protein n=1 Tax=Holotrichia oblita TaxID=644536 RepID=A0ACB9SSC6_HOLOL|nr:nyd-sp28 protein [Holotrichia oblita]
MCKEEFKNLRKKNCETTGAIWRDISELLRDYVSKTDKRRAQLADMKRLDAESAAEINQNQERIDLKEIEIERLKDEYITLIRTRKNVIRSLETALKVVAKQSLSAKQSLQAEITLDGKKLRVLTDISNQCLTELEKLVTKGEFMLQLMQSCRRFETEKEKVLKFADFSEKIRRTFSSDESEESDSIRNKDVEEVFMKVQMESIESKDDDEEIKAGVSLEIEPERRVRIIEETKKYKILIKHKYKPKITKSAQIVVGEKLKKELDLVALTSWKCPKKRSKSKLLQAGSLDDYDRPKTGVIEDNIDCLMDLEPLWFLYNKVKLDYVELREEKANLIEENEMMKQTIKSILEDTVLKTREVPKASLKIRYLSAPPK